MKAPPRFYGSEDYLHETAATLCGLRDFGDYNDYRVGLRVLLGSMDVDPRFTPKGRELAWGALLLTMIARAYTEAGWKAHPEWRTAKIIKPIFILGFPRTGTTVLHKLMGADPQFQSLEHWITHAPMPRPPREEWPRNPAYQRALNWLNDMFDQSPDARLSHNVVVDEYEECLELQRQNFVSNRWACTWTSPAYDAWWQTQSEKPTFDRYADILRLIGCHDPKRRWLLKNSGTISMLDYVFEAFPDACIIQTHRDPLKVVPSICSTVHHIHAAFEGETGARATAHMIGTRELEKWAAMVERGMQLREKHESQFMDIYHADFHARPMETIGHIYDRFGLKLSADAEDLIAARIDRNPEGHGLHRYNLADYGLRPEEISERLNGYMKRFGFSAPAA